MEQPEQSSEVPQDGRMDRLLLLPLLALLPGLYRCGHVLIDGMRLVFHPYETTMPESLVLYGAMRVARGERLYPDIGSIPYVIDVYNPLAYLPAGIAGFLFKLDLEGIRLAGRLMSYASLVLLAGLIAWWVLRVQGRKLWAALAGLLLFYFAWPFLSDFFCVRPDVTGLLMAMGAVGCIGIARNPDRVGLSHVAGASALCFVAFLYKQWFIAAPVAIGVYLLLCRQWKACAQFSLLYGGAVVLFLGLMTLLTGDAYYQNAIMSMAVDDVRPIEAIMMRPESLRLKHHAYGLLLAFPFALLGLARDPRHLLLLVYFFISALWTFYSSGKFGASLNYFSEVVALMILMVGMALAHREVRRVAKIAILCMLAVQVYATLFLHGPRGEWIEAKAPFSQALVEAYRDEPGEVFISNESLAIHAGRITALDWLLLDHLWGKGLLQLNDVADKIGRGEYSKIVLNEPTQTGLEWHVRGLAEEAGYEPGQPAPHFEEWTKP